MAKNDITPERKHKRDTFFKKPKQTQRNKKEFQKMGEESRTCNSFFIKNTYHPEETASTSKQNTKRDATKKPFDKKKWRLQRYSKKYKLQQWEETRKKTILKEYYKQTKDDTNTKFDVQKIYEDAQEDGSNSSKIDELENENNLNSEITNGNESELYQGLSAPKKKKTRLNAYQEYQRVKEDKLKRREEIRRKREERDRALKEYKKEKTRKFKKLNRKTSRGQPVMKYRMQMLLEQIQHSITK